MNYELCAQYLPLEGELKREDLNDSKFTFDNPLGRLQILPIVPPKGTACLPQAGMSSKIPINNKLLLFKIFINLLSACLISSPANEAFRKG